MQHFHDATFPRGKLSAADAIRSKLPIETGAGVIASPPAAFEFQDCVGIDFLHFGGLADHFGFAAWTASAWAAIWHHLE
jgi:hypothetical protein